MEKEVSNGTMLGIGLIALATTMGLGFTVYALAKDVSIGSSSIHINVIDRTTLTVTSMLAWLSFLMSNKLTKSHFSYYANRFLIDKEVKPKIEVRYIENKKLSFIQMLVLLFKPLKYKKVEIFDIDNYVDITLQGTLTVSSNILFINDYYLSLNSDLFEYIDKDIELTVRVPGFRQAIIKSLPEYEVLDVKAVQ